MGINLQKSYANVYKHVAKGVNKNSMATGYGQNFIIRLFVFENQCIYRIKVWFYSTDHCMDFQLRVTKRTLVCMCDTVCT